jgi:hypothetical protein
MKSPYEVPGISPNATPEEIRLAYRETEPIRLLVVCGPAFFYEDEIF